ncbi:MAG: RNase adapter RapZ [Proteobacteria bacterium]|nr:RNase adapter RapZ [Pseudomonadota bacterium]
MSLIIISGRSGSGKSTALHVLEDMGYYCIDNLPVTLLRSLIERLAGDQSISNAAVSIDARNIAVDLVEFPEVVQSFDKKVVATKIIYLDSSSPALVKRFSETRRKHPLSDNNTDLREALEYERELLRPISNMADLIVDTTNLSIHELRDLIKSRVAQENHKFALLFQSFAYKNGVPVDADIVFDVRCLPNPHWKPNLRNLTGLDKPVQQFLDEQSEFLEMFGDLTTYLQTWLPRFEANNRSYMTIAVGCTGGQHRSVYICLKLFHYFAPQWENVQIRHRELSKIEVKHR